MTLPAQPSRVEEKLKEFIVDELLEEPFHGDDPLAEGAVDSLGIEQLIDYISQTFQVDLDEEDEEAVYEHFESLPTLAALVDSKLLEASP